MAEKTIKTRIQLKNDTEANWKKSVLETEGGTKTSGTSFVPLLGELIVFSADEAHPFSRLKVGDGTTNVVRLPFIDAGYKTIQTAITAPTAETNKWVSSIGQDANGNINTTYSVLDTSGTWNGTATKALQDGSGNEISSSYVKVYDGRARGITIFEDRENTNPGINFNLEIGEYQGNLCSISADHTTNLNNQFFTQLHFWQRSFSSSTKRGLSYGDMFVLPRTESDRAESSFAYEILTTKTTTSIGASNNPVFFNANGQPQACGDSTSTSTKSLEAISAAGSIGFYSNGSSTIGIKTVDKNNNISYPIRITSTYSDYVISVYNTVNFQQSLCLFKPSSINMGDIVFQRSANSTTTSDGVTQTWGSGTFGRILYEGPYSQDNGNDNITNYTTNRFAFRQYSHSNSAANSYYDVFRFPSTSGNTASYGYTILTTKQTVTIEQGGTGAKTAAQARTNLGTWALISDTYNTLMPADGETNDWIKIGTANTSYGLLPSQSGNAGSGHNYLGTNDWYWSAAFIDTVHGNLDGNAATATKLFNTPSNTTTFLRGDNTWSNTLEGQLKLGSSTTSSAPNNSGIYVHNTRGVAHTPDTWGNYTVQWYFDNGKADTGRSDWATIMHIKGWNAGHAAHQISFNAHSNTTDGNLYHRTGVGTTWENWRTILDSVNYSSYAVSAITSTDNVVPRFNGTAGQIQSSRMSINDDGLINFSYNGRYPGDTRLFNSSNTMVAEYWYDTGNATNVTSGTFKWAEYSPNTTADTTTTGYYEAYSLPTVTTGLTANKAYNILTTKDMSFSITGNAATVSRASFGDANNGEHNADNITSNGLYYYTSNGPSTTTNLFKSTDGAIYCQAYDTNWVAQIAQDYRNGALAVRSKNRYVWQEWLSIPIMKVEDDYPSLLPSDGINNWIKIGTANTNYGLLPSQLGNAGNGHNYIGTSTWYWKYAYIDKIMTGNIYSTGMSSCDFGDPTLRHLTNLACYESSSSSFTGTIKIKLPNTTSKRAMMVLRIIVYDYNTNAGAELLVSGYGYSNKLWYNYSASVVGNYTKGIRLAHDGTNYCVLLGATNTNWNYSKVILEDVYSGGAAQSTSGYSITLITSESGYTVTGEVSTLLRADNLLAKTINVWPQNLANYCEGIRIHAASNNWCTLMLCGSDNTADQGTSTNSWGILNYNGTLYINKGASSAETTARAYADSNGWHFYKAYGAVWNDYAEFRKTNKETRAGQVVIDNDDGSLSITNKRLMPGAQIVSDTFGFSIGESEEAKTPLAVSGRVLVYTYRPREEYHAGMAVCSAPNGTIDIMTREEIQQYPDAIIGIVSEIPDYEEWGAGKVKVNGRIWIKIK